MSKAYSAAVEAVGLYAEYPFAILSLNQTLRNGTPSYCAVTAPFSVDLLAALQDRDGAKILLMADGAVFDYFNQDTLRYDLGPSAASISLAGYRQQTNTNPATLPVLPGQVTKEQLQSDGNLVLGLVPGAVGVSPGDYVTWGGLTYLVTFLNRQIGGDARTESITLEQQP